jgi:hypothetical protein
MKKIKRLDGIVRLTPAEIAERDARAQHWMNQRKIERVWEGCVRWHSRQKADREALTTVLSSIDMPELSEPWSTYSLNVTVL